MPKRQKVVAYARARDVATVNAPYDQKFADFIKTLSQARIDECDAMLIAEPWVLGDTYDEIIESLSRLAESKLGLLIVGRGQSPWTIAT